MPHHFIFTTSAQQFAPLTKELIYIDMSELSTQNAYNTMKKVCHTIGLPCPPNNPIFSKKIADSYALNIEKDFFFPKNTLLDIPLTIKILPYENTSHKKFLFLCEQFPNPFYQGQVISICIIGANKSQANKKLRKTPQAYNKLIEAINTHLQFAQKQFMQYERLKLNESDVLEFFKNNQDLYAKFSQLLHHEISNVAKKAPEILKNWIYYREFLQINSSLKVNGDFGDTKPPKAHQSITQHIGADSN
ncbi:DUF2972 domain-containing protein [Helicobacter sp. 12S02634-8]|uniref:DUF2972 domain-containing protein n=1 Tax=Helicobacter sp. 12S02634-8 TaxID=1476199 RepID=UPI00117B6AA3|nr:DUF2972 domain-containing protein [Helicobacter sp. 12S02634-8]